MTEVVALENVTYEEFTKQYNRYASSHGKETSPNGRRVTDCASFVFHPTWLGRLLGTGKGSGLITLNVQLTDEERTNFSS